MRQDQKDYIHTENYKKLEALEKKELRSQQLDLLKEFLMTKKIGGGSTYVKRDRRKTGIQNIHPHRFRRTLATNLIDKGMLLEQVQRILAHKKIETTLIYANVNQQMTRMNHQKFTY